MPGEINDYMLKKVGDKIEKGEIIAESKAFISWFKSKFGPILGKVESVFVNNGQVLLREPPLPVEVKAYLNGEVVEIIPNEGIVVETVALSYKAFLASEERSG